MDADGSQAGAFVLSLRLQAQTFTTVYTFPPAVSLYGGLVLGPAGELYGATTSEYGTGEVYELLPPASSGGAWAMVVLDDFVPEQWGTKRKPDDGAERIALWGRVFEC